MRVLEGQITPEVFKNRQAFLSEFGLSAHNIVSTSLVHGARVTRVDSSHKGQVVPDTDALITNDATIVLTITAADCLPVYFYNPGVKAIGLAHAGWKGILKEVAANTAKALQENFESRPEAVKVFIGPHLQKCHFEVKRDVIEKFNGYGQHIVTKNNRTYIDLAGIVRQQLESLGVQEKNIRTSPDCTYCLNDKYFSFRRDKPEILEAQLAFVSLQPPSPI